ncbi:hypothetical protein EVJ50_01915 [Synechococcus sp. RSCCF101]|nr:hypothetical protein EVJ50_01915 [Synechococcus sp. RSCCF101]
MKDLPAVGLPGDRWYSPMYVEEGIRDYTETILSIDPSGRGKDEATACVLSQCNGYIFLRAMDAWRDGYSDATLVAMLNMAKKYKATTILYESNFGDGMFGELLKRHMVQMQVHAGVEEVRASVRKEERIIDALEPILNQHKLVIDPKVIEWDYHSNPEEAPERRLAYMLSYQLTRMCREKGAVKHDDRADCLAQGVQWFIDALAISAHKAEAQRKAEEFSIMMDLFLEEPQTAVDALAMGIPLRTAQRRLSGSGRIETWTKARP